MSTSQKATAKPEPYTSQFDVYQGIYRLERMVLETPYGDIALDRHPEWLIDGMTVQLGGQCTYASVADSQDCTKVPLSMIISDVKPQ